MFVDKLDGWLPDLIDFSNNKIKTIFSSQCVTLAGSLKKVLGGLTAKTSRKALRSLMKTSLRALRSFWRWAGHQEVISVVFQGPRSRRFSVWRGNGTLDMSSWHILLNILGPLWRCEIISTTTNSSLTAHLLSESSLFVGKNRWAWSRHQNTWETSKGFTEDLWHHLPPGLPAQAARAGKGGVRLDWDQGFQLHFLQRTQHQPLWQKNICINAIMITRESRSHSYVLGYCVLAEELHET